MVLPTTPLTKNFDLLVVSKMFWGGLWGGLGLFGGDVGGGLLGHVWEVV